MPDVLEAPLVATTFDDGYAPTSAGRSHFRLSAATLTPWTWSLGSSMSGGVEVSARGGLRLATTHNPYALEEGTQASLHQHQHQHHQRQTHHPHHHPSRYYPPHHQQGSHQRQQLSTLENLSHHRSFHLLNQRHGGKGVTAAAVTGRHCLPLTTDPAMRANERWVLLNKETFQEIFDATLHQMTHTPGDLLDSEDRKSSPSSLEQDAEVSDMPPSPTMPEGLCTKRTRADSGAAAPPPTRCNYRKRSLSDTDEREEIEVKAPSVRRTSPLIAMAPTESARTMTMTSGANSALNDITNDRPGQRYSPAISSSCGSASSSGPPSPRMTSPNTVVTSPHSPLPIVAPSIPDRENNEPLDLSNKRSPVSNDTDRSPYSLARASPKCSSNNNSVAVPGEQAKSPTNTGVVAGDQEEECPGEGCLGLTGSNTAPPNDQQQNHHHQSRASPVATELRQKASLEGDSVRANGSRAPVDPRAPSPRGTEAGGGGVAAGGGGGLALRAAAAEVRGAPATTHPPLAGGESSSSSSGRGSVGGGVGGGGSSSTESATATSPVSFTPGSGGSSSSSPVNTEITNPVKTTTSTTSTETFNKATHSASQLAPASPRDTSSPNSADTTTTTPTHSAGGGGVTPTHSGNNTAPRMISETSGGPATSTGTTTSLTSRHVTVSTSGVVMKPASENWMPLNKATVYDLVEEVMFSLGEDEEEKVKDSNSGNSQRKAVSPCGTQQQQPRSKMCTHSNHNNNNNNAIKRCYGEDTAHLGRRHRCSPPVPMERGASQGHAQEERLEKADDKQDNNSSWSAAGSRRSAVSTTKSQLRNHLSARSQQQGRGPSRLPHPHQSDLNSQEAELSMEQGSRRSGVTEDTGQEQLQLTRRSPVRHLGANSCVPQGDSSSSPTSKAKQQQCWVALNKNVVYNIVDSAMRNSETEEEDEESEEQFNASVDPRAEVNGHCRDQSSGKSCRDFVESDSNSASSEGNSRAGLKNTPMRTDIDIDSSQTSYHPIKASTSGSNSQQEQQQQQKTGSKKRHCDTLSSGGLEGGSVEAESAAKRSRTCTPSPPAHPDPASPRRACVAEGVPEGQAPTPSSSSVTAQTGAAAARRTCLQGLLSESSTGRRTPPAPRHPQPLHPQRPLREGDAQGAPGAAGDPPATTAAAGSHDGGSKVRKSVHLADCQTGRIDRAAAAQSPASQPQEADGNAASPAARSPPSSYPSNTPFSCGGTAKNQCSSQRGGGSTQVRGAVRGVGRDLVKGAPTMTTGDVHTTDFMTNTKHGMVPVPVSKHGLVAVSPSPTDARSSPRLGWVAVSKIDVHNIVDSVVDSMIAGDMLTSSSSPSPTRDDVSGSATTRSPVPSPPSSTSRSPPPPMSSSSHHVSNVTSPVPARDAECLRRATSPQCPSLTSGPGSPQCLASRSPHRLEAERRSRGTPSPLPASPGSPRSPGDVIDRCSDAKSTKAFKWKSSLLMRVEEEKIDVTPEVATTSGRSAHTRSGSGTGSGRQRDQKSESRSLRSGKRGSRKGGSSSTSKLK